ncbi:MAG TPA: hypothetical protein VGF42_03625 [Caulobacteraceae bacterium]|jgi:uncharacterized protein HemX
MSDLDPDRVTQTRTTTTEPIPPTLEVTRTVERSSGAAWWAVALVGVALIIAVTYVITRPQSPTNTDAAVAAATQQVQTQDASQQAQSAATQAQSAADSAAQASQRAAMSGAAPAPAPSAPPPSQPAQPSQGDDSGGGPPQ